MRADFADGTIAYIEKSKFKQPTRLGQRRLGASLAPHFVNQLIGNQSKRHDLSLLSEFSRDCRINTVGEIFSRGITLSACIRKGNCRIDTEGEKFLFASKTIGKSPQLYAMRLDKEKEAAAVRKLERFFCGLNVAKGGVGERHESLLSSAVGIRTKPENRYQQKYQQNVRLHAIMPEQM
jgi:hypothetical protein